MVCRQDIIRSQRDSFIAHQVRLLQGGQEKIPNTRLAAARWPNNQGACMGGDKRLQQIDGFHSSLQPWSGEQFTTCHDVTVIFKIQSRRQAGNTPWPRGRASPEDQ